MDNQELKYFLAITEENSLTKAAQKLYLSQSALSQFLSKLEKKMGVLLFQRMKNNALVLTPAGIRYQQYCEEALRMWDSAMRDLAAIRDGASQTLMIGIGISTGQECISHYFASARKENPALRINIVTDRTDVLQKKLLNRELQLVMSAYRMEHPELQYELLTRREMELWVPEGHPLAAYSYFLPENRNTRIPLSKAGNSAFAIMDKSTVMRQIEEDYFERIGYRPNTPITVTSSKYIIFYVSNGACIGMMSKAVDPPEGVMPIALDPPLYYNTAAIYRKDYPLTQEHRRIIELYHEMYPLNWTIEDGEPPEGYKQKLNTNK